MERRDLIKDQIEQLGRVLGKILGNFLKMKSAGKVSQGVEIANQQLESELDVSLEQLLSRSKSELKAYLLSKSMTAEHLETLSDLLREIGESKIASYPNEARGTLTKSLELLDIADEITETASFIRMDKRAEIESLLPIG